MKMAIYGAGSLGTVLGAYISKTEKIDLVNRNRAHIEALREKGARITGKVEFTVPVNALTPEEMTGGYDLIFLMTKQQFNAEVIEFLRPQLAADGIICTLQNGLPEPAIADALGQSRVLGCTVAWGAMMTEPGVAELTSEAESLSFGLGQLGGVPEEKLLEVKRVLELMCPVVLEENFMGGRWSKLLVNGAFSGMSAVLGCDFGGVVDDKKARLCAHRSIKECIDVARAAGIRIEPIQGKNVEALMDYNGPIKQKIAFMLIPLAIKKHRLIRASMLQDLEKGKKCEIDSINGAICDFGRRYSVPTPFNDRIVKIVHEIEDGKHSPGFGNLALFDDIL